MPELKIKLMTALAAGSGVSKPGIVDHDVVYDRFGLPYLPSKRLKGLLRDALREIRETGCFSEISDDDVSELLGLPGAADPPCVWFASRAQLKEAAEVGAWLAAVEEEQSGFFPPSEVLALYTTVRRQTAIERKTGAPSWNTLRASRELRRGLEFFMRVDGLDSRQERILALAALAVQHMGGSRTRGPGWVSCCVCNGGVDMSLPALQSWEQGNLFAAVVAEKPKEAAIAVTKAIASPDVDQATLRFQLTLRGPTIFATLDADPNTVATLDYIPATAIHGLLAREALRGQIGSSDFERLFTSGKVRCSPAWPVIQESTQNGVVAIPIPGFWRSKKLNPDQALNLAAADPTEPIRRLSGWTSPSALAGRLTGRAEVAKNLEYHHQRDPDPRMGRPGDAEKGKGALFTYESIAENQVLEGRIDGDRASLEWLRDLVKDGSTARLGRSRSVQYGQCEWKWLDLTDVSSDSKPQGEDADDNPITRFAVLVLSPLIALNKWGHSCTQFPERELSAALGGAEIIHDEEFVRSEWHSGWLSHQRLPRQQVLACSPGSVFIFKATSRISASQLDEAGRLSYGLRREQGFGRVLIQALDNQPDQGQCAATLKVKRAKQEARLPLPSGDSEARKLAERIFLARVERRAAEEAFQTEIQNGGGLSQHALSRLLTIVQTAHTLEAISTKLAEVAQRVMHKLDVAFVECEERRENGRRDRVKKRLPEFIEETSRNPRAGELVKHWTDETATNWNVILGQDLPRPNETALICAYLAALLKKQIWLNRERSNNQGETHAEDMQESLR
jgi:CRISPR-associated protein Csx10